MPPARRGPQMALRPVGLLCCSKPSVVDFLFWDMSKIYFTNRGSGDTSCYMILGVLLTSNPFNNIYALLGYFEHSRLSSSFTICS